MVDLGLAVQRRGCQAQPLGAARHGRVVDRLHIDLELVDQPIADVPAQYRVADDDRDYMARIVAVRDLGGVEPAPQQGRALAISGVRWSSSSGGGCWPAPPPSQPAAAP